MPTALLRACPTPGCPNLTEGGPCPEHARQRERWRGSAASRGYDSGWVRFKRAFIQRLITLNIVPVCGARLVEGPSPHSACAAAGKLTDADLHLDHDPPLTEDERADARKVCDPWRVGLLCESCHNAKTRKEQQGAR